MSSEVVIRVDQLSKKYILGKRGGGSDGLRHVIHDLALKPLRRFGRRNGEVLHESAAGSGGHPSGELLGRIAKEGEWRTADEEFYALRDVSFEIKRGEVVGIIGRNGAGKSTLLKILSRITEPTSGRVGIKGRVASLLEVGTGFHPELNGRENIFLNGAILGMSKAEIKKKFDEIVAFAEIEKFIDTPVKRYSSGMYVRLAFAVAAHLEPEILVVDEVLAVGDVTFQKKCMGKMGTVAKEGRTVLFVSHNMGAVIRLCQQTFWLKNGKLLMLGPTRDVVAKYLTSSTMMEGQCSWEEGIANVGVDEIKIFSVRVLNDHGEITAMLDVRKSFFVEMHYRVNKPLPYCRVGFVLSTGEGVVVFEAYDADNEQYVGRREPRDYIASCEVPANLLNPGCYVISINVGMPNIKNLAYLESLLTINIEDTGAVGSLMFNKREGIIRPQLNWQYKEVENASTTACSF
jgi:lipopolysaccharide transport system ATP-binding protein